MCCESCPNYEDCAVEDKLKNDCCRKCPDYANCRTANDNEYKEAFDAEES